jgi:hypothetical protein
MNGHILTVKCTSLNAKNILIAMLGLAIILLLLMLV